MMNREAFSCPPRQDKDVTKVFRFNGILNLLLNNNYFTKRTYSPRKRDAFTLAEVLITLGIIGVVAALTMPSVIGHYKKQETLSRLKKAYTTINQALKFSEAQNGEYEYWDTGFSSKPKDYIEKYWIPYFNVLKVCNTYQECNYNNTYPYTFSNGQKSSMTLTVANRRVPFITSDGILYSISTASGDQDTFKEDSSIYIDINGSKGPNTYGKDLFVFTRVAGKGILPMCYNYQTNSIELSCSKSGTGGCCAQWIIMNGWQFTKDYPW